MSRYFIELSSLVRVTLSCVSRILIFSSWMFVIYEGNFDPVATISAFYITFLIMIVFNLLLNVSERSDLLTPKYWIGKIEIFTKNCIRLTAFSEIILNSYSSVLHYNHIDYQAMLDEEKKKNKKRHEPTIVRQFIYFLIFCSLFIGFVTNKNEKKIFRLFSV